MTERNTFPMPWIMSAEDAAHKMADGIASGRPEVVFPTPMLLLMKTARLVPVRAWAALLSRAGKKAPA